MWNILSEAFQKWIFVIFPLEQMFHPVTRNAEIKFQDF